MDNKNKLKKDEEYYFIYDNNHKNNKKNDELGMNEPFGNVVGHKYQKEELLNVINWFNNWSFYKEKGISIPKGIIMYGAPGNGKSLFIKEIINYVNAPVLVFQGDARDIVEGVYEVFKKAREIGHSIIVFDELDLLINKERRVIRALQDNLDGVESFDDVLVVAATNELYDIPSPLLRSGRLEKTIFIPCPNEEEAITYFKKQINDFGLSISKDVDFDELALSLNGVNYADIKSIVNDIVLRNGFVEIDEEMIDNSILFITDSKNSYNRESKEEKDNFMIAIHEASHAVMARSFSDYYIIKRLIMNDIDGEFSVKEVRRGYWPSEKVIASIKISLAGVIGQKLFFKESSFGVESDLQRARSNIYRLYNLCGYRKCSDTLPSGESYRRESFIKLRKMERKIEKKFRKLEKEVKSFIKKHKNDIYRLALELNDKKKLKQGEILAIIG